MGAGVSSRPSSSVVAVGTASQAEGRGQRPDPFRDRSLGDAELAALSCPVALEVAAYEGSADGGRGDADAACHGLNGERP